MVDDGQVGTHSPQVEERTAEFVLSNGHNSPNRTLINPCIWCPKRPFRLGVCMLVGTPWDLWRWKLIANEIIWHQSAPSRAELILWPMWTACDRMTDLVDIISSSARKSSSNSRAQRTLISTRGGDGGGWVWRLKRIKNRFQEPTSSRPYDLRPFLCVTHCPTENREKQNGADKKHSHQHVRALKNEPWPEWGDDFPRLAGLQRSRNEFWVRRKNNYFL